MATATPRALMPWRVIDTETMTCSSDGRPVDVTMLRQGQRVTVQGSEIIF